MVRGYVTQKKSKNPKKKGRWYSVIVINGKEEWLPGGELTKKAAEEKKDRALADYYSGTYRKVEAIAFAEFADLWLESKVNVKESTKGFYAGHLKHLLPFFGKYLLTDITRVFVQRYVKEKLGEGKLSATTIGYHIGTLRLIFKEAVLNKVLRENPAEHVKKPRASKQEMAFLTLEEAWSLIENASGRYRPLFLAAILTGMRQGELLGLGWSDINWMSSSICVRQTWNDRYKVFDTPKSGRARTVKMSRMLANALLNWKVDCPASNYDLVFPNADGKPLNPANLLTREFFPALERAGLPRIRFHDLRHTFASLMLHQGESIKFVQEQLGHATPGFTLDRYGHLMPNVHTEAADRLAASLGKVAAKKKQTTFSENTRTLPELLPQNAVNGSMLSPR